MVAGVAAPSYRARASVAQAKALAEVARCDLARGDVADSWIVARHFCLRYGSEVVPLGQGSHHSTVTVGTAVDERHEACITPLHRKIHFETVPVTRRCICKLQGPRLCGVCIVRRRLLDAGGGRLFPEISHALGLVLLKAAAEKLGVERASEWGTHAFHRGWADEAFKSGGATALFYSGDWRGLAAFGYTAAKTPGALAAAEWLVDFQSHLMEV